MKSLLMIVALSAVSLLPGMVKADDWKSYVQIGDSALTEYSITPNGMRILLPSSFDNFNCLVQNIMSNDGRYISRQIACVDNISKVTFIASATCQLDVADKNYDDFKAFANGTRVKFIVTCETSNPNQKPAVRKSSTVL